MGKITEALKKVADSRVARIQRRPEVQYVAKRIENTTIDPHIVAFHDPTSPIGEQYKIMRTNIQTLRTTKGYKTFIITSSINGEGKTITAVNLAMTMASDLNDKSVLVVDADMRKGKVAKYLGMESNPGLAEILQDAANLEDVFVSPSIDNLTVIPCGKTPKNPSELLGSRKMQGMLNTLRNRFDYIFIDTPPVMPLTDPCIIGAMVDGAIMVVQAGRTQRGVVKHMQSRLQQARVKTLGYVISNVEYHLPQYLYRYIQEYSHYKYYKPEKKQPAELQEVTEEVTEVTN